MRLVLLPLSLWALFCIVAIKAGVVPIPPGVYDAADWEALDAWRHTANFTHTMIPKHVSRWTCMMATEKDCRDEDEALGRQKLLDERKHRSNLQKSFVVENNASILTERELNPSKGSFQVLVLLVRFKGDENKQLPSKDQINTLLNGQGTSAINPVGSVREYLRFASLNQYVVNFVVQDWFQISKTEVELSKGQGGRIGATALQPLFSEALAAVDAKFTDADWKKFDTATRATNDPTTPDLVLDHLVVIHSGWGAEWGDSGNTCGANTQMNRIWSQGTNGVNQPLTVNKGTMQIGGYVVSAALDRVCINGLNPMGVLTHEYLHGFRLRDLYDQDYAEGVIEIGGAGNYDIMANTYGWNINPMYPGTMGPVSKMDAKWLSPIEIVTDGVYAIQPSATSSQVFVIRSGFPSGEYLLIENRQVLKWDADWPASGIVVWHVDLLANGQTTRGYPGHANWPAEHYMVAVLQADGKYEIEKGISRGDAGDFWSAGMILRDSDTVWPNTASYQGGILKRTGITIEFLTKSGFLMSFRVSGLSGMAPRTPILSPADTYVKDDIEMLTNDGVLGEVDENWIDSTESFEVDETIEEGQEPGSIPSTGSTAMWVLSVLGGVGTMLGLLAVVL
jgi:M6 family metalloprotease-like protein